MHKTKGLLCPTFKKNKAFWKIVKPFLSDKIISKEKITSIEENQIVSNNGNTAQVLNTFFSNFVGSLSTLEYVVNDVCTNDPISDNISDKWYSSKKHSSTFNTGEVCKEKNQVVVSFLKVDKEERIF